MWPSDKFLKTFGQWSEIFGKSSETSLSVCLFIIWLCLGSISAALSCSGEERGLLSRTAVGNRAQALSHKNVVPRSIMNTNGGTQTSCRLWVRFPPRSKDFFFTSRGSLIPFTRASAQWIIHGFNLHFRVNSLFHRENLDLGRVYRPYCVRPVLTTSAKILPYRPPGRLQIWNISSRVQLYIPLVRCTHSWPLLRCQIEHSEIHRGPIQVVCLFMYGTILKSLNIVNLYPGMSKLKIKINVNVPQLRCIVVSVALNDEFGPFGGFCVDCCYTL